MNTSTQDIIKILFDIEAIKINTTRPFTFSSGVTSPIYCDNRLIISYPEYRKRITAAFIETIKQHSITCDIVVGTATAGIPHAAWLADELQLFGIILSGAITDFGKLYNTKSLFIRPAELNSLTYAVDKNLSFNAKNSKSHH